MKAVLFIGALFFMGAVDANNDIIAGQLLTADVDLEALAWECYNIGEFTLEITEQVVEHLPSEPVQAAHATCHNLYTFYI